jgi:hypothetical protein
MLNKFFLSLLLLVMLLVAACSDASENGNSQSKAANSNQNNRSEETQANGSKVVKAEGAVAVIPPANSNRPGPPATDPAITGKAPKLFLPVTNADYGKVKAEKSFTRTFDIKNNGNAPLNIEAVTPG